MLALGLVGVLIAGTIWALGRGLGSGDARAADAAPRPARRARAGWARALSFGLSCAGLVGIGVFGSILVDGWHARWTWARSETHERIERHLQVSSPRWVDQDDASPGSVPTARSEETVAAPTADGLPEPAARTEFDARGQDFGRHDGLTRAVPTIPAAVRPPAPVLVASSLNGSARSVPARVEVERAELRFLDPPEPGAHALLAVRLRNRSDAPSEPVSLGISTEWFGRYRIIGAIPPVLDDRTGDDATRHFDFPGLAPGQATTLELHVTAAGEDVDAPEVRLAELGGEPIGRVRAETVAPRPRPGPAQALSVPRLGIRTGVVQVGWEPPAFVAGQLAGSAALGEGNTVLVGHRGGHAGDVFVRLAGARLGDEVAATSRGLEHRWIVSEIRILPGSDVRPIQPTERARLTLMTCIGGWNPLTGDYSHRLWVVAEPPEQARSTLMATVERASHAQATAATPGEAARARADAAAARAALTLMRVERRGGP